MSTVMKLNKYGILLETNRLTIGEYRVTDLEDWFKYAQDEKIAHSNGSKTLKSKAMALDSLLLNIKNGILNDNCSKRFAIREKGKSKLIGNISVYTTEERSVRTLGYWMGAEYRNKGYMYEALNSLIDYLRESYVLQLDIFEDNMESLRLAEKLGFSITYSYKTKGRVAYKLKLNRGEINEKNSKW